MVLIFNVIYFNKQILEYTFSQSNISGVSNGSEINQEIPGLIQKSESLLQEIKERKSRLNIKSLAQDSEKQISEQSSKKPIFNIIRDPTTIK